jgi:hypothetical protein
VPLSASEDDMPTYKAPLEDVSFLLNDVFDHIGRKREGISTVVSAMGRPPNPNHLAVL